MEEPAALTDHHAFYSDLFAPSDLAMPDGGAFLEAFPGMQLEEDLWADMLDGDRGQPGLQAAVEAPEPPEAAAREASDGASPPSAGSGSGKRREGRQGQGKGKEREKEREREREKESRWAEQLLNQCAAAIAGNNAVRTQHLMWVLNDLASFTGDANQRLAAYGLKALFCRVTGAGEATSASYYNGLEGFNSLTPKAVHRALLKFQDVSPWHQLVHAVGNGALLEAMEGQQRVHVVDIGVSLGTQWPTLMEALATRAAGPPALLRITLVMDQGVPSASSEFLLCLERFAKFMGLQVEINTVIGPLLALSQAALGLREQEALAVCAQFRLHALSEEGAPSARDSFLRVLRSLRPLVMVLSENDCPHLAPEFAARFSHVASFFWRFFDSNAASYKGKASEERQIVEYEAGMMMLNAVACDGFTRIERNEPHAGWVARMRRAAFAPAALSEDVLDNARAVLRKYDSQWDLQLDMDCAVLLWKNQPVTFCSVWTCS